MKLLQRIALRLKGPTIKAQVFNAVVRIMPSTHVYVCQLNIAVHTKAQHSVTAMFLDPPHALIPVFSSLPIRYVFPGNRSGLYRLSENDILQRLMHEEKDILTIENLTLNPRTPYNMTFAGFLYPIRDPQHAHDIVQKGWRLRIEYDYFKTAYAEVNFKKFHN